MSDFTEGAIKYIFPDETNVIRLESSSYYRNHWQKFGTEHKDKGNKEVDFIYVTLEDKTLWLIEAKDYRQRGRQKDIPLDKEFALKCRDSLSCLAGMRLSSWATNEERQLAAKALKSTSIRCILHIESSRPNKLFPQVFDASDIADAVRHSLRALDPQAKAGDAAFLSNRALPFTITL